MVVEVAQLGSGVVALFVLAGLIFVGFVIVLALAMRSGKGRDPEQTARRRPR